MNFQAQPLFYGEMASAFGQTCAFSVTPASPPPPLPSPPPPAVSGVTLSQAVEETVRTRTQAGCRPKYVTSLRQYLHAFARGRETLPIATVGLDDLSDWFRHRNEPAVTEASNRGRLRALFALAWRRRWIVENPCDRLEPIRITRGAPSVLTVDQCETALRWTMKHKPRCLAWLVLAMLAGVRPDELGRITWNAVNFEEGTITIDAAASKVRRRRIVPLMPSALAWLRQARYPLGAKLPIKAITHRRFIRALRNALDLEAWPHDVLRHTAASYLLVHYQDAARVALMLGNSPGILQTHYMSLVTQADCARFWAVLP